MPLPRKGSQRVVDFDILDHEPTDVELEATTTRVVDFDNLDADAAEQPTREPTRVADVSDLERSG